MTYEEEMSAIFVGSLTVLVASSVTLLAIDSDEPAYVAMLWLVLMILVISCLLLVFFSLSAIGLCRLKANIQRRLQP